MGRGGKWGRTGGNSPPSPDVYFLFRTVRTYFGLIYCCSPRSANPTLTYGTNCTYRTYARLVFKSCWKIAERQEIIFLKLSTSDFSDKRRAKLCAFAWKFFFVISHQTTHFSPLIYLYFSSSKSTAALLLPSRNICSPEFSFPPPPSERTETRGGWVGDQKNFSHLGAFLLPLLFQVRRLRRL